jgi:acetoin utilization deacetylase AcuC-like enzyme
MKVFFSDAQMKHEPKSFLVSGSPQPSPEQSERATRLLAGAKAAGLEQTAPADLGLGVISAVHTPEYVAFLSGIYERWQRIEGASDEVIPNIHPDRRDGSYPASAVGQAGFHQADTACPIGPHSWESIYWSAMSAGDAARAVQAGEGASYALCRPPGHHAFKDFAGGFCFVNNSGVAAQVLRQSAARVAILDVDLHAGNGTQGCFYDRNDILTVSIHADPERYYPFFWGHADERGVDEGLGYNYNLPIPRGTGDDDYMPSLEAAIRRIDAFAPDALVIALGLDAYVGDPFAGLAITTDGFARIAERIGAMNLPTVMVQEGGYLSDDLGPNLTSFLTAFGAAQG